MKLVTINKSHLKRYTSDSEMLQKADRPCVLVMKLIYKERRYTFAVPLRSNISPSSPKNEYFPLPTRSTTKDGCRHGLHYIKMFPVNKSMYDKYRTENDMFSSIIKATIDKHEKEIVSQCQEYLKRYEAGNVPRYATDIDSLINLL